MVEAIEGIKIFAKILKLAIGWLARPWLFLYRYLLRNPLLLIYKTLWKLKKIWLLLLRFKEISKTFSFSSYLAPLFILIIFSLIILASNVMAQSGLRPENYGKKNILFKILPPTGEYYDDELLDQDNELSEGPITQVNTNTSYVEGVLSAEQPAGEISGQGFATMLSTADDRSVLISPEITDPSSIAKRRDKIITYSVQPGDAISTIAAKFGVSVNTILWENSLTLNSTIRGGQILKILPVTGLSYAVSKRDTLKKIASKYKADEAKILEFNKMESAEDLQIGQLLIIPDGVKQAVAVAAPVYSAKNIITPQNPANRSATKLQWPTSSYRITQYRTWRHTGIDVGNKTGQPVYAAEDGVVEAAGWNRGGYGYYIIINHGGGLKTLYAHHSKLYVSVGQKVSRGQVIGAIGSTGRSTGPHLHFEVILNGAKMNPLTYVR